MENVGLMVALAGAMTKAPTAEQVTTAVDAWLDDHPEATTTVQDGSITEAKLNSSLNSKLAKDSDVAELKKAMDLNAGNELLNNWQSSSYYKMSSSVTSIDVEAPTTTAAQYFKSLYVACQPGDVFYVTLYGTSSARPFAFLSSANGANNIISRAGSSEYDITNYKLVAPAGSEYAVFNAQIEHGYMVIKGDLGKEAGRTLTGFEIPWEIGNIKLENSALNYVVDRYNRVRTPEWYSLDLNVGDVVGMSSYASTEFYAAWVDENGGSHISAAKTVDYVITQKGKYAFLLRYITEPSGVAQMDSLASLFFVKMLADVTQVYTQSKEYTDRQIQKSASGMKSAIFEKASPKFAMHRGYSTLAPENTAPAFELAGQNGAWGIETDIYETTDGYFVCHHDSTVDRMTDGTGNIAEMTLSQVEALTIDAGANIGEYENLKIPTLETFLSVCRRYGCVGLIEIKSVSSISNFVDILAKKGMSNSVVILLNNETYIPKWRNYTSAPIAYVGYSDMDSQGMVDGAYSHGNTAVDYEESTITDDTYIDYAHSKNMPVIAWTVDTENRADALFRLGVDVITTNSIPKFSE